VEKKSGLDLRSITNVNHNKKAYTLALATIEAVSFFGVCPSTALGMTNPKKDTANSVKQLEKKPNVYCSR
jgi:hypothetical protein